MAEKGGIGIGEILLLGVGGYLVWQWLFPATAATAPAATAPTSTTPVTTAPPTTPVTKAPPPTPVTKAPPPTSIPPPTHPASPNPGATLAGPVTLTGVNNALSANVKLGGGTIANVSIIYPALTAWDTTGKNVTQLLTLAGVNVPALANTMLASYQAENPGATFVSGLSGFLPFIWGRGMGQARMLRGQNYVRAGAPMRRIG